mmetsp:Transcript_8326/g.26515  ORF Transcript_8326/g.26515 Transcript_8326/m.26515 type:complete len:221 (-) Transcript_8326:326-988(-)
MPSSASRSSRACTATATGMACCPSSPSPSAGTPLHTPTRAASRSLRSPPPSSARCPSTPRWASPRWASSGTGRRSTRRIPRSSIRPRRPRPSPRAPSETLSSRTSRRSAPSTAERRTSRAARQIRRRRLAARCTTRWTSGMRTRARRCTCSRSCRRARGASWATTTRGGRHTSAVPPSRSRRSTCTRRSGSSSAISGPTISTHTAQGAATGHSTRTASTS